MFAGINIRVSSGFVKFCRYRYINYGIYLFILAMIHPNKSLTIINEFTAFYERQTTILLPWLHLFLFLMFLFLFFHLLLWIAFLKSQADLQACRPLACGLLF